MQHSFRILILFLCTFSLLPAQTAKLDELRITRITRQGVDLRFDDGFFRAPSGEVQINFFEIIPERTFADTKMTPAVVTRVNGRLLVGKSTIDSLRKKKGDAYLDLFTFSSQVYPAGSYGEDCYIVTLAGTDPVKVPTVTVKSSKSTVTEGAKVTASFDITLSKAATTDTTVIFKFSGTAKSPSDYRSSHNTGSIKIKKGKKTAKVTITLRDNKLKEPKEKLVFTMKPHTSYKLGSKKSATITIKDNDK